MILLAAAIAVAVLPGAYPQAADLRLQQIPFFTVPGSASGKKGFTCGSLPAAPIRDLIFYSVYKKNDPHRAQIDKEAQKEYQAATNELNRFESQMAGTANNYLKTGQTVYAHCALGWLYEWAQGGALLGEVNELGVSVRHWTLASLASAYAQIQSASGLDPLKAQAVEDWLEDVARTVIRDYPNETDIRRKRNNHLYWAAWAVTMTGLVIDNRAFYDWGINKAKYAIYVQMQDDGTLPLEMGRGKRALHYHIFAAVPLIMIAEAGAANGDNLYALRDGMLHKFVERLVGALDDPSYFEGKSGYEQSSPSDIAPGHFAWMEAYNARFPNEAMQLWLQHIGPVFNRRTGGDMTFIFHTRASGVFSE